MRRVRENILASLTDSFREVRPQGAFSVRLTEMINPKTKEYAPALSVQYRNAMGVVSAEQDLDRAIDAALHPTPPVSSPNPSV